MKISYEWIREYVPTKIRAANLAKRLTISGLEVSSIKEWDNDFIFDIEVTPNRPDCLSHIGVAREVSAITKKPLKLPPSNLKGHTKTNIKTPNIELEDEYACPRYTARIISGVKVAPSPKWLRKKMELMGLRPVNNIVDITNYVLFETGQPLHAFDYDKISGGKIIIRAARQGEKITTIDNIERTLKSSTLVIADTQKPVAIAGIMGGSNTEVGPSTSCILLEAATFNQVSIRRSAHYLGLSSDSSYRFERGVDYNGIKGASDRAAYLICEIAKGKTHKALVSAGKPKAKTSGLCLRPAKVNAALGINMSTDAIKSALSSLRFKIKGQNKLLRISVPSFRSDIQRETDLIEEIARVYGYDNIPCSLPRAIVTDESPLFKAEHRIGKIISRALTGLGFCEILTCSLLSKDDLTKTNAPEVNVISIQNPLSKEQEVMRNCLLPSMLKVVSYNLNMQNKRIKFFEFSNIYFTQLENLSQGKNLALAVCGDDAADWRRKAGKMDIFYLKGVIEALFNQLAIKAYFEQSQHPAFEPGQTLAILSGDKMLGIMGLVNRQVLDKMDIKNDVYACEINAQMLFEDARPKKGFKVFSRFPRSQRDISIYISKDISYERMSNALKTIARPIIKNIELAEEYHGKQVPAGQRSILFRVTYQSKEATLKEREIEAAHNAIREKLVKEFNAILR